MQFRDMGQSMCGTSLCLNHSLSFTADLNGPSSKASALHPSELVFLETGTLNTNTLVCSAVSVVRQGCAAFPHSSCMNLGCLTPLVLPEDGELAVNQIFSFGLEIKSRYASYHMLERNLPVYYYCRDGCPSPQIL